MHAAGADRLHARSSDAGLCVCGWWKFIVCVQQVQIVCMLAAVMLACVFVCLRQVVLTCVLAARNGAAVNKCLHASTGSKRSRYAGKGDAVRPTTWCCCSSSSKLSIHFIYYRTAVNCIADISVQCCLSNLA